MYLYDDSKKHIQVRFNKDQKCFTTLQDRTLVSLFRAAVSEIEIDITFLLLGREGKLRRKEIEKQNTIYQILSYVQLYP